MLGNTPPRLSERPSTTPSPAGSRASPPAKLGTPPLHDPKARSRRSFCLQKAFRRFATASKLDENLTNASV